MALSFGLPRGRVSKLSAFDHWRYFSAIDLSAEMMFLNSSALVIAVRSSSRLYRSRLDVWLARLEIPT